MKNLIAACLLLFIGTPLLASHVAGGNIEVQYVGVNQYRIIMKLYRACEAGSAPMPTSVDVGIYQLDTDTPIATYTLTSPAITANLPFGDSCYTPTGLCVDRGIFTSAVITIPDHAAGYYLHSQVYARNSGIDNLSGPGSTAMSFYTEIPDPAIGPNNTPQFGPYPGDAYLCIGFTKYFDFGVTDADGDSLSYELVDPLAGASSFPTTNGTFAKPYPAVNWLTVSGFSLANICGGAPPMSVDPITGVINASPAAAGKYVFALKVHEWRAGIKIGETTLDIQYEALPCTVDSPPAFTMLPDTIDVHVETQICFDIMAEDLDGTDTIYVSAISSEFDLYSNYVGPVSAPGGSGGNFYYLDYLGNDTLWMDHYLNPDTVVFEGVGIIPLRYCWTPPCEDVDSTFGLDLITYSLGCSGSDTTRKHVEVRVVSLSPPINLSIPDTIAVTYGDSICFDVYAFDTIYPNDTLFLEPYYANFDLGDMYVPPTFDVGTGTHYYLDFLGSDTIWLADYQTYGDTIYGALGHMPLRYCWTPECDDVNAGFFDMSFMTYSTVCKSDTTYKDLSIDVNYTPPPITLDVPATSILMDFGDYMCMDILASETANAGDTLYVTTTTSNFNLGSGYEVPSTGMHSGQTMHYYNNFFGLDTLWMENYNTFGSTVYAGDSVGLRYCWTADCGDVFQEDYTVSFMATSSVCNSDTVYETTSVHVDPPVGGLNPVPNVFTPNGDSKNDYFELDGIPDPCYDTMNVEIYNRWGQKVFESTDPEFKWDGKNRRGQECADGIYYVVIKGSYGSAYDPTSGVRIPFAIENEFHLTLYR